MILVKRHVSRRKHGARDHDAQCNTCDQPGGRVEVYVERRGLP